MIDPAASDPDAAARTAATPAELFDRTTVLGQDLAAVDWVNTPLGAPETWSLSLRSTVRLLLGSRFAMWMAWGPELTFLCNDAYRIGTLGKKYPWALGRPAPEVWSEVWPDVAPLIGSVIHDGASTWNEHLMLFLERSGYQEETYHTFSYSPIIDDDGVIAGMLCVVSEETARVVGDRRMATVRDLGTSLAGATTELEVCAAAGRQLAADSHNLPFAMGYLYDEDRATLAFTAGVGESHPLARYSFQTGSTWPMATSMEIVDDLGHRFGDLPTGAWSEPPVSAAVIPLAQAGHERPFGVLVAGLNRYRVLDEEYRGFLELIAGQIAAALTRARALEQERRRAADLAELDRAKTTFFTNVSHELRTPLTLLLGPASDALSDVEQPLPDRHRDRIEVVHRSAERLLKLVNTLLDFSRMEAGRLEARFEPLDLAQYTAELAAMFDSAMARAGLDFVVDVADVDAGDEPIFVDREMWAKIVLNLISNALKATFTGAITVSLRRGADDVQLVVRDTGIGIAVEEQGRLFERFHRVTGAHLRSHEGSGVGLALVAELAALHGGHVDVLSATGAGSTFTVSIPSGTQHLPAEQISASRSDDVPPIAYYGAGYLAEASRWLSADPDEPPIEPPGERPRVLVVDDNADMRDYIVGLLAPDYDVAAATDGEAGLAAARRRTPDLILTDVMMPRLDGFGLLAALRADPELLHLPVVMLSARSGEDATVIGLEAGADDYLIKPFTARELRARVRSNLELDRVRRVADELARSRSLLDEAEELAHVGSWELDLATNRLLASPEFFRILGLDVERFGASDLDVLLDSLVEADRAGLAAAFATTARTGEVLDLEFSIVTDDATPARQARIRGRMYPDADGPGCIRGSTQDISDQRAAERAIAMSAAAHEAAAREHAIADELQRSLLPARTPRAEHMDVAAYYVAGVEGTQAGGDWYDVIDLGGGRTALVIGDVMGRGVRAAAVMGQLRATVRAYAKVDLAPARLLRLLDSTVLDSTDSTIVTCVYAVHDATAGTLTYGNAGHMPPLLSAPGEAPRRLGVGDPPLGTGGYLGNVETVEWPVGARLVLYTDGLVEHRGSDLDVGIDRLADELHRTDVPVEALPNVLVQALLPNDPDDDVAMLAVGHRDTSAPSVTASVPPDGASVAAIRATVRESLGRWGIDPEIEMDALLVISELVTNAIRYGKAPIEFRMRVDTAATGERPIGTADEGRPIGTADEGRPIGTADEGRPIGTADRGRRLVVEVSDAEPYLPTAGDMQPDATGGRGLHIVDALCASWGTRPTGAGKSVWCTLPLSSP